MRHVIELTAADTRPHGSAVLARLRVPPGAALSGALCGLLEEAAAVYDRTAAPVLVFEEVLFAEFEAIYAGAGRNEPRTPVPAIARRAGALALFAGTLGPDLDASLSGAFRGGNAALGCVLDVWASLGAERLADLAAARFGAAIEGRHAGSWHVLPYSPGYCGWHVSGQKALFERLRPADIGITLNPSALMRPIKSVSGVLVAATADAHRFSPTFPFCDSCSARECLDRMRALRRAS